MAAPKKKLGEILVNSGLISETQLQEALKRQNSSGERLGKALISLGYLAEQDIINVLEYQLGIRQVDVSDAALKPEVVKLVSEALIRRYKVLPLEKKDRTLVVAMADPLNVVLLDDLKLATGLEIEPVMAREQEIESAIQRFFGFQGMEAASLGDEMGEALAAINLDERQGSSAPVVRAVNTILLQAIQVRASDIHLEPQEDRLRVRFRVDGVLRDVLTLPKNAQAAVLSRLKIMAGMDIAEKRLPQDGRVQVKLGQQQVDLRVSSLPTVYGEKIALRILDKSSQLLRLEELGFSEANRFRYLSLIRQPYGMVLLAGPTGSGKTTTLYATLNELNKPGKNLVTVEDPVEYVLAGINQISVNVKAGLTFAAGLRSILRQDPDIIMIGEVRDGETAGIAVRAATTGHLVFSTLHTNDAAGSISRLIDMGVEPFLVASSVIGVVAQRLVRRVCPACRAPCPLPEEAPERALLGGRSGQGLVKGKGCRQCHGTGYAGRISLQEVMPLTSTLRRLVLEKAPASAIRDSAQAEGMVSLREDGLNKALQGLTTLEEVLRVSFSEE